jgi:hypothetical protein
MSQTFNLTLCTQNTTNIIDSTNKYAYKYYINWDAFLPRHFDQYLVNFTFKSVNTTTSLGENLYLDVNFGASNTFDQSGNMTSKIGFIYPQVITNTLTNSYFYQATQYDNVPNQISYPSNNIITVKLYKFDGTSAPTTNLDYVLELSFTPIIPNLRR